MADKRRGRKNVEKRLIDSAAYLVGSVGPNQLTIRDIADHAGVNHAQIHHYFGGKKGLLIATYKQLAFEHVQQLERRNVSPNNLGDITIEYGVVTDPGQLQNLYNQTDISNEIYYGID